MADGVSALRHGAFAAPIYDPLREWLDKLPLGRVPGPDQMNALCIPPPLSGGGVPIRFVAQQAARSRSFVDQFEVRTFLRGEVALREESWHDLFNALAWLAFPHTKAAINQRHFADLEHERRERGLAEHEAFSPGGKRSATRDTLTLFDESGIIVASPCAELLDLIRLHQWKTLFWTRRLEVKQQMRFFTFGHALHEKAMQAYKGMTARALMLPVPVSFLEQSFARQIENIDEWAARYMGLPTSLESKLTLSHLPVMGIPDWDKNATAAFYDDAEVFRQSSGIRSGDRV